MMSRSSLCDTWSIWPDLPGLSGQNTVLKRLRENYAFKKKIIVFPNIETSKDF
jgi:hypothetical protein